MMFYTVYRTVNLINGKYYFGVHKTQEPHDDYLGSGTYIKRAVAKYGREKFRKEVLFIYLDPESAFGKEDELIQCYRGLDPLCMNLRKGGSGGFDWINHEGLNNSNDNFKKASIASVKRTSTDPVLRKQKADWINSVRHLRSDSFKIRAREWVTKWKGQHHTAEAKVKISTSHLGKKNHRFGTKWLHQNDVNCVVPQKEVSRYLGEGWVLGKVQLESRKIGPEGFSWCNGHQDFLPVESFGKNKNHWNGLQWLCKQCGHARKNKSLIEGGFWEV